MYRRLGHMRPAADERGETQLGIIIGGLLLGVLCWGLFSLESCIRDHKDGKVVKRHQQMMDKYNARNPAFKPPERTAVRY